MHPIHALALMSLLLVFPGVEAQPLRLPPPQPEANQAEPSEPPLVLRAAANPPQEETVEEVVSRLRDEMRAVAQSTMTAAERKAAMDEMLERNSRVLKKLSTEWDENRPQTIDEAVLVLEQMLYEVSLEAATDEATRESIIRTSPSHLDLEPNRPLLIAPRSQRKKIVVTRQAEEEGQIVPWWRTARFDTEALDLAEIKESPVEKLEPPEENEEEKVKVETLQDEKVTVEMHDDTTILRQVEGDDGDLVLFDALHFWIGGAAQGDAYSYEDLFTARAGGGSEEEADFRRAEVIVRATLFDWGEVKAQYDVEGNFWRDLYYRRVNEDKHRTLTIGNQMEPMSPETLLGNKFTSAMEQSAPTSAFAPSRGMGIRLNRWFERTPERQWFEFDDGSTAYITATAGIFGQDIEDTSDTDLALTGRLTMGRDRPNGSGLHVGGSATFRDGDFDRIAPRPEIHSAGRVSLANFEADTQSVVSLETMFTRGSMHAEGQVYLADYRGGDVDAQGFGAYGQVGYYLTGQKRGYRPKWGLWEPVAQGGKHVFEVFARASFTYGDSDEEASNDLRVITVGGNWFWRKYRVSINGVYAKVDRGINNEDDGLGITARVQYLF
jgi:phosphate-selective porin